MTNRPDAQPILEAAVKQVTTTVIDVRHDPVRGLFRLYSGTSLLLVVSDEVVKEYPEALSCLLRTHLKYPLLGITA